MIPELHRLGAIGRVAGASRSLGMLIGVEESPLLMPAGIALLIAAPMFALFDSVGTLGIIGALALFGALSTAFYVQDHLRALRAARDTDTR